ncbi:uncharacterized protein LOC141649186 [Silene latifolia]|uniref:uncharacterized protein LOC141649186 n=1 Tax=Silene latifolia TaxID=37657 RepID=UPI003D774E33
MGQQQPQCVITDQCPGIKKACPNVFKHFVHKYCMWHIMQKMPEKVGRAICNDTEFMTDINAIVWDVDLEPEEFEQNWKTVIEAHRMQSNRWLKYVFAIRQKWIPAYFRDLPLGCLLRTTHRSESSNSYFKRFESHFGTLVEFWMRYNSAVHRIPEPYVLARWTKKSYRPIVRDENGKVIEDIDEADIKKADMSKVWSEIYAIVGVMDGYATVKQMKQTAENPDTIQGEHHRPIELKTKNQEIEALLGITASNDIDLRPPNKAKNKGSGKRLRSSKEKAKSKPQKRKRRCGNCKKQLKEKKNRNYTEADMDNQFIAGVNALKKYYTEVDISISGNWTPVLKAMELMEGYKNPFQDESVEVESTVQGPAPRR